MPASEARSAEPTPQNTSSQENQPIMHRSRHGTAFRAARTDLVGGVYAGVPTELTQEQFGADCIEFGWWHRATIMPDPGGFRGPVKLRIHRG